MDTTVKLAPSLKPKVLLWTDVSYHDMEEINKMQTVPDLERALSEVFKVDLPEPKRAVLLELLVQMVLFCREQKFKSEQTSALLSLIKHVHQANIVTPLNNIDDCFRYCKELLICHSVRRPPYSINLFSLGEVIAVLKYINNNYLRHYKFYKYVFTPQLKLDLSLTYSGTPEKNDEDAEIVLDEEVESSAAESGPSAAATGPKSELKMLIEKEVKEQLSLVSGQLDQQMKITAECYSRAVENSRPSKQT